MFCDSLKIKKQKEICCEIFSAHLIILKPKIIVVHQHFESNGSKMYELHKHNFHNLKLILNGTFCKYGRLLSQFNLWSDSFIFFYVES